VSIDFMLDQQGIATITINRPERMNAMDDDHYRGLSEAWSRVRDDDAVRVAIVTGAGDKAFTVGADLKSTVAAERPWPDLWKTQAEQLLNRGLEIWKPVIAAVNGYCLGGGVTLMLATDIRIACASATFSLAEVKRGVIAANGGTQRLISQLPYPIAMEMLLTGDSISADVAERWGLINRIVPTAADVLPAAMDFARRISGNAPLAVQASKELALRARDLPTSSGLRFEQLVGKLLAQTSDAKEGVAAFIEKRPPDFKAL
jgi:E-phenylitaconyl-CoA hydratase